MADQKDKKNIFKRIGKRFTEVRLELKRVIWPTKEKLIQTSVVVLAVIVAATVLLTMIGQGGTRILERLGFYGQVVETTAASTTLAPETTVAPDTTTASTEEDTSGSDETEVTTVATTEAE